MRPSFSLCFSSGACRGGALPWRARLIAGLGLLSAAAGALAAPSDEDTWPKDLRIEDGVPVRISYDLGFTRLSKRGFLAATIAITNGTVEPLAWKASLVKQDSNGGSRYRYWGNDDDGCRPYSFKVEAERLEVPAGSTREFQVWLPVPGAGAGSLEIQGPHVVYPQVDCRGGNRDVLVDDRMPSSFFERCVAFNKEQRASSKFNGEEFPMPRTWSQFPEDRRAYSSMRSLVLRVGRWVELSGAQRGALCGYVANGGRLCLVVDDAAPWALPSEFGVPASVGNTLPAVAYGLGMVRAVPLEDRACLDQIRAELEASKSSEGLTWLEPLPAWLAPTLPRVTLILVLLGSALLAGPGALFWLAKRQQRHRLFYVLPAIAAGTTVVFLGIIFLHDGIGGAGRRAVLAALVDGRPEMVVYQEQAARCGFLLRTAFTIPEQAMAEQSVPRSVLGEFLVERTGGECRGDWFRNRSATVQTITHTVPTRAALELRPAVDGGAPTVVSTFPAPLRDLVLVLGAERTVWRAAVVAPGTPTQLVANPEGEAQARVESLRRLNVPFHGSLYHLVTGADLTGRFFAATDRLEGAPIATLDSIRWTDTILVTGRCTEGRQP